MSRTAPGVNRTFPPAAGDAEAVGDVLKSLAAAEGFEVVAGGDPLIELAQLGQLEILCQFGLADEHDLQELLGFRLEIGQQAYLFEYLGLQVLRFVDDEDAVLSFGGALEEILVEFVDHLLDGFAFAEPLASRAEVIVDGAKQLLGRQHGVEYEGDIGIDIELVKEAPADGGFPGAHTRRKPMTKPVRFAMAYSR